jgi:hypothetical protein
MVDLAFGPEPGPRRDTSTAPGGYLEMQRRYSAASCCWSSC